MTGCVSVCLREWMPVHFCVLECMSMRVRMHVLVYFRVDMSVFGMCFHASCLGHIWSFAVPCLCSTRRRVLCRNGD